MPSLVVERGQERGLTYGLDPSIPAVCGREPTNAIVISDPAASRRHFQIHFRSGRWYVEDLGSRNGTFLNEEPLEGEAPLEYSARVQVGETVFSFLEEDESAKGAAGTGLNGKTIGGYLILERVGRGGMGTVYKARQISLNRLVALKILASRLAKDPSFIARFVAEARAAAQLNHPNVVQVLDSGESGGLHFFSMEFIDHGSVQDELAKREDSRYPWTEALPLVMDAAEGLVFAERRGIIHRDIKPDNLMLSADGQAKIADLGLATRTTDEGDGKIFGTPHFVSPEQAQGKTVTHAADIYSLGATFYRMVAGRTPFSGKTVKEILRKQISEPPTPIAEIVPDFPEDLADILEKMMAKRVEDRYQSATALLEDLRAFELAHKIELAGGRKANKPLLIAMGTLVVGLLAVVGYFVMKPPPPEKDPTIIRVPSTPTIIQQTGPTLTVARLLKEIDLQMQVAKGMVLAQETPLGAIALDHKEAWGRVADAYDALKDKWDEAVRNNTELADLGERPTYDKSETVVKALERATEIRTELDRLEQQAAQRAAAAATWWTTAKTELDGLVTAKSYSEALARAKALADSNEGKTHLPALPAARAYLKDVPARVDAAVRDDWETLLAKTETALSSGNPAAALQAARNWIDGVRASFGDDPALAELLDTADDWLDTHREELSTQLEQHLRADLALYVQAYRSVRHIGPDPNDTADANLVFNYRFADAAAAIEARAGNARTYVYQDLFARKIAGLRQTQKDFEAFVASLPSLFKATDNIEGIPAAQKGSKATLNPTKAPSVDGISLRISVRGGGFGVKEVGWSELSPAEIGDAFVLPRLTGFDAATVLGLARVFVELGELPVAEACLNQAVKSGATFADGEEARLRAELLAMQHYGEIVHGTDATPKQRIELCNRFRSQHFATDFFVLQDGASPLETKSLVPEARRLEFLEHFGTRPQ